MKKLKLGTIGILSFGLIIATIVCLCLLAVLSKTILSGRVGELGVEAGINIIILISVILGGAPYASMTSKKPLICMLFGFLILMILLILGLLIDGKLENILPRTISVLAASAALCTNFRNGGKYRKKKKQAYR